VIYQGGRPSQLQEVPVFLSPYFVYNALMLLEKPKLKDIIKPYENQWVALSPDYSFVVSAGETLRTAAEKVPENMKREVVFMRVSGLSADLAPILLL